MFNGSKMDTVSPPHGGNVFGEKSTFILPPISNKDVGETGDSNVTSLWKFISNIDQRQEVMEVIYDDSNE